MLVAYERLILNWSCRDSINYPESESTQFTLRQGTSALRRKQTSHKREPCTRDLTHSPGTQYGRHCGQYLKILSIFVIASSMISTDKDI